MLAAYSSEVAKNALPVAVVFRILRQKRSTMVEVVAPLVHSPVNRR